MTSLPVGRFALSGIFCRWQNISYIGHVELKPPEAVTLRFSDLYLSEKISILFVNIF